MKLYCQGYELELEDVFVDYSPLLSTLRDTEVGVEHMTREEEKYIKLDVNPYELEAYINLISGHYEYVPRDMLEYMGHENPLEYPDDFFSVKVYDNWVRDNFYKFEFIISNPWFGLEEVDVIPSRVEDIMSMFWIIPDGAFIAGSAAMYMTGDIDDYTDVDIFVTDRSLLSSIGKNIKDIKNIVTTDNSVTYRSRKYAKNTELHLRAPKHIIPNTGKKYVQVILREYTTLSEIVHGFDIDCCGYIFYSGRVFRTMRAKHSTLNKKNYFDPARSSPSYANRLSKYNIRGYDIWIPFFDRITFNEEYFRKLSIEVLTNYVKDGNLLEDYTKIRPIPYCITQDDINLVNDITKWYDPIHLHSMMKFMANSKMMEQYGFDGILSTLLILYNLNDFKFDIPNDPVSKIMLSKFKKIYLSNISDNKFVDYEMIGYTATFLDQESLDKIELSWEKLDPMKQLSGTFFPEPIQGDILQWYSTSPYITVVMD